MVVWATVAASCGGDVYQEGPDGQLVLVGDNDGDGRDTGSGAGSDDCSPCRGGDCGLCILEAGADIHRCPGGMPPDNGRVCSQTGAVYHDGDGSSYVCWRCD